MNIFSAIFLSAALVPTAYGMEERGQAPPARVLPESAADLCVMKEVQELSRRSVTPNMTELTLDIRDIKRGCEESTQTSVVVTQEWEILNLTVTPPAPAPTHG